MSHYSSVICLLVLLGNLLIHSEAQNSLWDKDKDKFDLDKPGYFHNCGNNATEAYMRYTPAKLYFGDVMHINFHVIPQVDVSTGYLNIFVYDPEESMDEPVYNSNSNVDCKDIHKYFMADLCPFKKGVPVDIKNYKKPVPPSSPIPTGTYVIKLYVYNRDPKEGGQELFCLMGTMCLLDS